jgi:hypothetical protein
MQGQCKFKMHTQKKTNKQGIKVMIFADYKTHYCYNAYMDCGKNSDGKGLDKDLLQLGKPT